MPPFAPHGRATGTQGNKNLAFGGCVGWLPGEVTTTKSKDNRFRLFEIVEALGAAESFLACHGTLLSITASNSVVVKSTEKTFLNIEKS